MARDTPLPLRIAIAHPRLLAAVAVGVATYFALPRGMEMPLALVLAWDAGALVLLGSLAVLFMRDAEGDAMAANAIRQQDGEWVIFAITIAGALASFVALSSLLGGVKSAPASQRGWLIGLVGGTLLLSWVITHILFAVRYAHEYYTATEGVAQDRKGGRVDGGLEFPGEQPPDYWDFVYFGIVLGMTFQVSDVQITSQKLRRLATVHGLIGFLFNATIIALTVNIAAGLLG